MTRSELVARIARLNPSLLQNDAEKVVDVIFDTIKKSLKDGNRVELRGFGVFSVRQRKARQGRNPRTGEEVKVAAKRVPFFKSGKKLKEELNSK